MPTATTSRARKTTSTTKPTSSAHLSRPSTKTRPLSKPVPDAEKLADQLAASLRITDNANVKGKKKTTAFAPSEEERLEAMRLVNSASHALSGIIQTGWKKSSEHAKSLKSGSAAEANEASKSAAQYLKMLRSTSNDNPNGSLNVERAAMSILSKLVALDMYDAASLALTECHPRLCALLGGETSHLLSLPLQPNVTNDSVLLTLISTYLSHAIVILSRSPNSTFCTALVGSPSLLQWVPLLSSTTLPPKHLDSILTKAYNVLTKLPGASTPPKQLFEIRMYALRCLAYTTPGTIHKPDNIWEQGCRVAGAYVKGGDEDSALATAQTIISAFLALFQVCEARTDRETFISGKGFATFCETWIGFATKARDVKVLDKIAELMRKEQSSSGSSSATAQSTSGSSKDCPEDGTPSSEIADDELILHGTRLCAAIAQLNAALDQQVNESEDVTLTRIREARAALDPFPRKTQDSGCVSLLAVKLLTVSSELEGKGKDKEFSKDLGRVAGKVERALERTRKACSSALERQPTSGKMKEDLSNLLGIIAQIYETVIRNARLKTNLDHFTQALDTLFILSRSCLSISDPRTYGTAYDYLARAVVLLSPSISETDIRPPPSSSIPIVGRANFIRCTSGVFHNLGGTLYQAGRYGSAIPFLKEACRIGKAALAERDNEGGTEERKEEQNEAWVQLRNQLWRRWQLLGVCYLKIGDRKLVFDSFVQGVESFPYSSFRDHASKTGFRALWELSPAVKELGGIVEKLTYLGLCELMLPVGQVSLRFMKLGDADDSVTGALIERQVQSLQGSRWKEGVREHIAALLKDALNIYREANMPVRMLRVLAKCLELAYYVPPEHLVQTAYDGITPDDLQREAISLCDAKDSGKDLLLLPYRCEYQASIHLWLALHSHRRSEPNQVTSVVRHIDEACSVLSVLVGPSGTKTAASTTHSTASKHSPVNTKTRAIGKKAISSKAAAQKTVKGKAKTLASTQGQPSRRPVTPKSKARKSLQDMPLGASSSSSHSKPQASMVDSVDTLLELLELVALVLGMLALTLPKISVLDVSRKLTEEHITETLNRYISSSSQLAREYAKLGKTKRARRIFDQALASARSTQVSDETRCSFLLAFAEFRAGDDVEESIKLYREGRGLAGCLDADDKHASTFEKIQARVLRIEKTAAAHEVCGLIQSTLSDTTAYIEELHRSLRLWNRAFDSLGRLHPPSPKPTVEESNPFEVSLLRNALPSPTANTPQSSLSLQTEQPTRQTGPFTRRRSFMTGLEWRICQGLLNVLFALGSAYFKRGSPREAQYFAEQARDLAESLNAPAAMCRALMKGGEVKMYQGLLEEGLGQLAKIEHLVKGYVDGDVYVDLADIYRLKGDFEQKGAMLSDARRHYEDAVEVIERLDRNFGLLDGAKFGPRRSLESTQSMETLVPELLAEVLRQHVWLLRAEGDEAYTSMLNRLNSLPLTPNIQSQRQGLMARLALHDVYQQSRIDMFLSSMGETTIALFATSSNLAVSLSPASFEISKTLEHAETLFWSFLAELGRKGYVPDIRESAVSIAMIKAFQASLGQSDPHSPLLTAGLLDASSSLTLRSEMLEAIGNKFPSNLRHDELEWPLVSTSGPQLPQSHTTRRLAVDDSDEEDLDSQASLKKYWETVRQRYQSHVINSESLISSLVSQLPPSWTVVHISVTEDKNTMFISRQRGGGSLAKDQPLIFCVPLKGRREDAEDEHLTFEDALTESSEIVRLSNETTQVAASIRHDQPARSKWWKDRGALDTRLRELLENIEFCWLGAFKTILSRNPHLSQGAIKGLRIQFDRVFQRGLRLQDKKTKEKALGHQKMPSESWTPNRVTLDDALVECFSTLSPDCRDEELEDLVYFILDLYQFHGVAVAIAEVDIDQVVVDLRSVLEEYAAKSKSVGHGRAGAFGYSGKDSVEEHMFLVLDKNVQSLPWENIPVLRGRSVSRIPSISFLIDRVEFARLHQSKLDRSPNLVDRAVVDPRNAYYIMNPSGDLARTDERFRPWLADMEKVGWQGISGRAPSELQVLNALQTKDLVVYFGHGGAEQYVRSHKLRSLPRCAAVMLWGCSSGALRDMGDFDRVGTPLNYMLAGCPTLVANLWDVTDKDIDTFSQTVFDKMNMKSESLHAWPRSIGTHAPVSLIQAVAESRDSCKLKYLTGAAPVVYGIPFYL